MKKFLTLLAAATVFSANAAPEISRLEPEFWFAGMKNPSLQIMVYGKNIRSANFDVHYPGIKVDSVVRLDNQDYMLVYLDTRNAQSGVFNLEFSDRKKTVKIPFELRRREKKGSERTSFSNADVLYQLMPDRFAQGSLNSPLPPLNPYTVNRQNPSLRHGGNLEGIRQHLDYFNELGITALWFTPVLENNSPDRDGSSTYHGYAPTDYYKIDPRFGSNDDYRRFIDEAHQKGIKIVMDMIFNHCGFEHPWVKSMPSKDWFNTPDWLETADGQPVANEKYHQTSYRLTPVRDIYASQIDLHETVESWFVPSMPDLNQHNPHVIKYLIQNSFWWIETAGIDGIRMDTYPYSYSDAMSLWMRELLDEYPNFNVVGETWVTSPAYTASWQKDNAISSENPYLPTVMDFSFYDNINRIKHETTDGYDFGFNRVYNSFVYDFLYKNPSNVLAFIENHDTDRFLENGDDSLSLKQALAVLLTSNRIPQLYYGVEIMLNGTKEISDGIVRQDFPGGFEGDTRNAFLRTGRTEKENRMFDFLKTLLHYRQTSGPIVKGTMTQFVPHGGIYVLARTYGGKSVVTILNGTLGDVVLPVGRYAEVFKSAKTATDIITGRAVDISKDFTLTAKQTLILELTWN